MTPLPMRPAAVLLDMDGTLVDSDAAVEGAWATWAEKNGLVTEDVLAFVHGREPGVTIRRFLPHLDDSAVMAMVDEQTVMETTLVDDLTPTPGAHAFVAWLVENDMPWAVVTNANRELAEVRLGAIGITPPLLVGLDDVPDGKPAPDGYLSAARQLGVDPARCLAVEDSPSGLAAARAAGCMTAGVRNLPDADVVCADLEELLPLLIAAP